MNRLTQLFQAKSIAVIGGGIWCANVIRECRNFGFAGDLWAVHPSKDNVAGCPAVPSLADLPDAPDAAFVGVNRSLTVQIIGELAAMGAGGAVCFASGFSEASEELDDADDLQAQLIAAAGQMPILGPNCYGFINALDSTALWPDQHGLQRVDKGIAIISQSSNIALNLTMQTRGVPIAYLVTVGNQAQTGLSQIAQSLLDDPRVTAIGLHIEGIDDLTAFEQFALAAHKAGKPVTVLKIGKSEQAQAATISHTASLAGSMAGAAALFDRLGLAQVGSLSVFLETLKLQHVIGRLPTATVASMSCSGGEASLIADMAVGTGVSFPPLNATQADKLRQALGPKVALANPLDYHTYIWGDVQAMADAYSAMMTGPAGMGVVILDLPRADRCDPTDWMPAVKAVKRANETSEKPIAILSALAEGLPEDLAQELIAAGILPLSGMAEALSAIDAAATPELPKRYAHIHIPPPFTGTRTLTEDAAKAKLAAHGLRVPHRRTAKSPDEAAKAASDIGFPVVLKGQGIAHKSDMGAVVLNLSNPHDVASAAETMPAIDFLVEEMVTGTIAELLVGVVHDPAHGMVLTLAAGGVMTEMLQDSTSLILPATRNDIDAALQRLKIAPLLAGYRGKPPCDMAAIIDAVMVVQDYAMTHPVTEVEINPLLCGETFAIAADALMTCGEDND